jgi:hypothetical protein
MHESYRPIAREGRAKRSTSSALDRLFTSSFAPALLPGNVTVGFYDRVDRQSTVPTVTDSHR